MLGAAGDGARDGDRWGRGEVLAMMLGTKKISRTRSSVGHGGFDRVVPPSRGSSFLKHCGGRSCENMRGRRGKGEKRRRGTWEGGGDEVLTVLDRGGWRQCGDGAGKRSDAGVERWGGTRGSAASDERARWSEHCGGRGRSGSEEKKTRARVGCNGDRARGTVRFG